MNYNEILDGVKKLYDSVDSFAYGELSIPNEFVFTKAPAEAKVTKDLAYTAWMDAKKNTDTSQLIVDLLAKIWRELPTESTVKKNEYLDSIGLGPMEEVEQYGGEGKGETWYSVKYFPKHNVYIRIDGYYQSYDGTSFEGWGDCKEVTPISKTIIVYE